MGVDGAVKAVEVRAKRAIDQLRAREYPTRTRGKHDKNPEFAPRERNRDAIQCNLSPLRINFEVADPQPSARRRAGRRGKRTPDPGDKLPRAERLSDIIVGSALQARHDIAVRFLRHESLRAAYGVTPGDKDPDEFIDQHT